MLPVPSGAVGVDRRNEDDGVAYPYAADVGVVACVVAGGDNHDDRACSPKCVHPREWRRLSIVVPEPPWGPCAWASPGLHVAFHTLAPGEWPDDAPPKSAVAIPWSKPKVARYIVVWGGLVGA